MIFLFHQDPFNSESCAASCRQRPTPESASDGTADASDLLLARGATPLVCDVFRGRGLVDIGVVVAVRVLPSQAGRVLVTVDFAVECPSSE